MYEQSMLECAYFLFQSLDLKIDNTSFLDVGKNYPSII